MEPVLRIKGSNVDVATGDFSIWANVPLIATSCVSTVHFWEPRDRQPADMTPAGEAVWRVVLPLMNELSILGATYKENTVHLRIMPEGTETPAGIEPGIKDIATELAAQSAYGEQYRLLQGLDLLVRAVRRMAGMAPAAELLPYHDSYIKVDGQGNAYAWTTNGDVAVRAVLRDVIVGFNTLLRESGE